MKEFKPFEKMKPVYKFLFMEHDIGFMRFCFGMMIPCAFSVTIMRVWVVIVLFIDLLRGYAHDRGWNHFEN